MPIITNVCFQGGLAAQRGESYLKTTSEATKIIFLLSLSPITAQFFMSLILKGD